MSHHLKLLAVMASALIMAGCNTAPKKLYDWGSYQSQVYDHLKGQSKGPEQQIIDLEKDVETARAKGNTPPPGCYAHLGMLYVSVGRHDQAVQAWNKEKALFPESTQYVDFLLNNMKKQGG